MHTGLSIARLGRNVVVVALALALSGPAWSDTGATNAPALFASPDLAVTALREAAQNRDTNALGSIFGPKLSEIANPDAVQRGRALETFARHLAEFSEVSTQENGTAVLRLGNEHWPFPIPLVKQGDRWFFDTAAGKEEILNRRIGKNELSAIEICQAYVMAQREYALKDRAGLGTMEYAQHIRSRAGKKDGLYWDARSDEEQSPFGPLVARALEDGYYIKEKASDAPKVREPFHGYFFRILKKQGPHAPGEAYDYVINGHMVAGFALVAYPAQWGNTGVMSFIVNQRGKVCQKNLGPETEALAHAMTGVRSQIPPGRPPTASERSVGADSGAASALRPGGRLADGF
jgi:hypothetical protein